MADCGGAGEVEEGHRGVAHGLLHLARLAGQDALQEGVAVRCGRSDLGGGGGQEVVEVVVKRWLRWYRWLGGGGGDTR